MEGREREKEQWYTLKFIEARESSYRVTPTHPIDCTNTMYITEMYTIHITKNGMNVAYANIFILDT